MSDLIVTIRVDEKDFTKLIEVISDSKIICSIGVKNE